MAQNAPISYFQPEESTSLLCPQPGAVRKGTASILTPSDCFGKSWRLWPSSGLRCSLCRLRKVMTTSQPLHTRNRSESMKKDGRSDLIYRW